MLAKEVRSSGHMFVVLFDILLQGARLRARSEERVNAEEEEEESDDESIDEELGYISPLETANPYVTFKEALTGLSLSNAATSWH